MYVIGYYNQQNFGDEQYKITFKKLFPSESIEFLNIDTIETVTFDPSKTIVLGGGDVLNHYFLDKMYEKFSKDKDLFNIIAVSVGLPYIDILLNESYKFEIFNKIYVRTLQDIKLFSQVLSKDKIEYIPDLSVLLTAETSVKSKKQVCICVSKCIYSNKAPESYINIIRNLTIFIKKCIDSGYSITMVPFNTNEHNTLENDITMQNDIMQIISKKLKNKITNITRRVTTTEMNTIFSSSSVIIPMRFHACLLSIYNKVPFIPLYTTRKIDNLIKDIQWDYHYLLEKNKTDNPIYLDADILNQLFDHLVHDNNYENNRHHLNNINEYFLSTLLERGIQIQGDLKVSSKIKSILNDTIHQKITTTKCIIDKFHGSNEHAVQLVSYHLTGNIHSNYNYGLMNKMFENNYNYQQEWKWIILDNIKVQSKYIVETIFPKYNMEYMNQHDLAKVHRSGWQHVTDSVKYYNGSKDTDTNLPLLDLYIDRTFHWDLEINKLIKIVPYTREWTGVIHHTFDETFSEYNNVRLFKNEEFLESLKVCKGLIVLSRYLQQGVRQKLKELKLHIPVHYLCHPTEIVTEDKKFNLNKFIDNEDRQLVHIGGWMRNIYSFYSLTIPQTIQHTIPITNASIFGRIKNKIVNLKIQKGLLKGVRMNNYFPDENFINRLENMSTHTNIRNENTNNYVISTISQDNNHLNNNWYKHMCNDMEEKIKSVTIIEHVDNNDFDNILSKNIVFINLIDASAVNTLIECIVRNTPIIINKHPAVVELLGEEYPMYYNKVSLDINNLITIKNIEKTNEYLRKLDKHKFTIEYFMKYFTLLFV
jgi:hypothetical protein